MLVKAVGTVPLSDRYRILGRRATVGYILLSVKGKRKSVISRNVKHLRYPTPKPQARKSTEQAAHADQDPRVGGREPGALGAVADDTPGKVTGSP